MILQTATQEQTTEAIEAQKRVEPVMNTGLEDQLSAYVRKCWAIAKSHRQTTGLNERLADCLRRRKGVYDQDKINAIKSQGGSDIFMQLTGSKCRALKAWLSDLYSPAGDKFFALDPTVVPELPPEIAKRMISEAVGVMQQAQIPEEQVQQLLLKHKDRLLGEMKDEAQERAEKMSDRIEDLLGESDWRQTFDDFLDDFVTYPYGIIKGLEFKNGKQLAWVVDEATGKHTPQVQKIIQRSVRRVSPFRWYPSPAITNRLDGHWCIEHRTFTRSDLSAMRGVEGYHNENIAMALSTYSSGGLKEWLWTDDEQSILNNYASESNNETIDALEWSGSISGSKLLAWGMPSEAVPDEFEEYQVTILVVGNYVIRAVVSPDPAGKPDFYVSAWQSLPSTLAGIALPEAMSDCQDQCNASARSLVNNMSLSSGPQVWVDLDMMTDGADTTEVWPWKIWHGSSRNQQGSRAAIEFFQPSSHAAELMQIYERFARFADDITGLPAYAYGSDQGAGAAKTASGYSMMVNAASKTIKLAVRSIDMRIIEPMIEKIYNHLMLVDPDESIKGDAVPKARGSDQLIQKEQQAQRQQELLGMTANPLDQQIIGLDGRREQLEQVYKASDTDYRDIVPTKEELTERMAAQQQQMQQMQQGDPNAQTA